MVVRINTVTDTLSLSIIFSTVLYIVKEFSFEGHGQCYEFYTHLFSLLYV